MNKHLLVGLTFLSVLTYCSGSAFASSSNRILPEEDQICVKQTVPDIPAEAANPVVIDMSGQAIKRICEGVYAGQGVATRGEPIYFGMELLDKENSPKWERYRDHTDFMACDKGLMYVLAKYALAENGSDFLQRAGFFNPKYTGFTADELTAYMNHLKQKLQQNARTADLVRAVCMGSVHLFCLEDGSSYIAYVSKQPVTGRRPFLGQPNSRLITLKQFDEIYGDLLMCVGVYDIPGTNSYYNRGIFRNPSSFIYGGYKGISLKLHGFTGAIMSQLFENKKFLKVEPAEQMHMLLCNHIPHDQMFIDCCIDLNYGFPHRPDDFSKTETSDEVIDLWFKNQLERLVWQKKQYADKERLKVQLQFWKKTLLEAKASGGKKRNKTRKIQHASDMISELTSELLKLHTHQKRQLRNGRSNYTQTLQPGEDYCGEWRHFIRLSALVDLYKG